jgi:hypothetical protein
MCLVVLEQPVELDPAAAMDALSGIAPHSDIAVEARDPGTGSGGLAVRIDGHDYAVSAFPRQMPAEICSMVQTGGAFWAEREKALESHRGFLAISAAEPARGHGLLRAQAVALTRLAAALAGMLPVLGVVWPAAGTAVAAERLAKAPEQIQAGIWPVDLWIGFQLFGVKRSGGNLIGARSRGAAAYFGSEIEVVPMAAKDQAEPLRILMNTAGHLMASGPHLRDGQQMQVRGERAMRVALALRNDGRPSPIRLVPDEAGAV